MADSLGFVDGSNCPVCMQEGWGDRYVLGWWVVGPPSDPPSEFILIGWGVSPMRWTNRHWVLPQVLHPGSHHGKDDLVYFVPVITLIRMTHQDLPLLKVGSSSAHGTGWPLTWWMGCRSTFCMQDPICNTLSSGGWQQCPHSGPLFCTRGSEWHH